MRMYDLILKKRNGGVLSGDEIRFFLNGYVAGDIPDYQVSALMMAIYFKGMNADETQILVDGMVHSGDVMDLSAISGIKVDKHSTGGVGDKTSIVLAPLVAAAGAPVAKLSGRGLGHTGGTLDKLEAFKGFSSHLDSETFVHNVNTHGIAMAGQTANLVPADKKLYALRDVTATVENFSLIAGSIMSKKLAGGADAIVLDVKCGSGAFMKDLRDAQELAQAMVTIGNRAGKRTEAIISSMEQPLGMAVGNSLEVIEAIQTLKGGGPADLHELCMTLGSRMLILGGISKDEISARVLLQQKIDSGEAIEKLRTLVKLQGGDTTGIDNESALPLAPHTANVYAESSGYISGLDAEAVGMSSMYLGAGRQDKESQLDLGAGVLLRAKVGDYVEKGASLATLFTSQKEFLAAAEEKLKHAVHITTDKQASPPLIFEKILS